MFHVKSCFSKIMLELLEIQNLLIDGQYLARCLFGLD